MKQFFEGMRRWATLNEEQLLAEGRLEDAKKKYPQIDPLWIDRLSERDPSGNNKYLMWAAKQFAQITEPWVKKHRESGEEKIPHHIADEIYQAYRVSGDAIEKFHANYQRLKNKDINAYKTIDDVLSAIRRLGLSQKQKRRKKRERAREGSTGLLENDDFWMIRPDTTEASCYYGQGTKWCISATHARNYFESYTNEGKTFYMIMLKGLDEDDDGRKMALVYNRDQSDTEPEEIYDAPDDSIDESDFLEHIIKNLIGAHFADYEEIYSEYTDFYDDPTERTLTDNIKKLAKEMAGRPAGDNYDIEFSEDEVDDMEPEDLSEQMQVTFHNAVGEIFGTAYYHNDENPGGPNEETYRELLDEENFSNVYVTLDDYGEGMWWDGGLTWQLPELEYADDDSGEATVGTEFGDWGDEILQIFRSVADDNYVYPDESETAWNEDAVQFGFRPDYGENTGLEGFKAFLERMRTAEDAYDTILEDALIMMREEGITKSEEYDKRMELFTRKYLNRLKNFGATLEKGKVEFHQKEEFVLQLPLFRALGGPELRRVEPRTADKTLATSTQRDEYFKGTVGYLNTMFIKDEALKYAFDKTWPLAYDRSKEMQQQLSLTERNLYGEYKDQVQMEFTEYLVDLENSGELGAAVRFFRVPMDDVRGLAYADWLDKNLDTFYDAIGEFILKKAQESREDWKRVSPEKFEKEYQAGRAQFTPQDSEEELAENVSYGSLCESWKRWATE
jgi:hypothetical protein